MEFKIECPWCNQHYSVDDSFIGQNVECSVCGKPFAVRKPPVSVPTIEKTTDYSSNQAYNPEKKAFALKNNVRKVLIGCAVLVVVAVSICVVGYVRYIPEKEYKNGLKAYAEHRYSEAVEHFQKAANLGHSDAQVMLGLCYANGDGISRNVDEAVQWFRRSAEQNNPEAQYRMGLSYLVGIGVNPREEEAIFWLQKAIEQGHHEAQISLGDLYYEKADRLPYHSESANLYYSKALECYQNASKTGDVSGRTRTKMFSCKLALDLDIE